MEKQNNLTIFNDTQLQEINNKGNSLIQELKDLASSLINKDDINDEITQLQRIKEEMEKGLYFITIQGSLKTGKSTLTNLLINSPVAKTQAGVDTTKTAYVITKSPDNESRIVKYKQTQNIKEKDLENILKSIIDNVKGIDIENNKWKDYFEKEIIPLTKKNLEKYTVEGVTEDVLFINIQIAKPKNAENWILDHDIAILDTPGIEGKKAEHSQEIIQEIKQRTNMLIVMQSTITPINAEEIKHLNEYKDQGVQMRLMHNKFELKPWAIDKDKQKLKEANLKAIQEGKKLLKEFGRIPHDEFNLAKIEDFLKDKETYKTLEEEFQKFQKFNDSLINSINTIKTKEKKQQAKKQLLNRLREWQKETSKFFTLKTKTKEDIQEIEKNLENIINSFETYIKTIKLFKDDFLSKHKNEIKMFINGNLIEETNTHLVVSNTKIDRKNKDKIIKEIHSFDKKLHKEINEILKNHILEKLDNTAELLNLELKKLTNYLEEVGFNKYSNLIPEITFNTQHIPDIIKSHLFPKADIESLLNNDNFLIKEKKLVIFNDKYLNIVELENHIKNLYKKEASNNFEAFIQDFGTDIYNNNNGILDEYIQNINSILDKLKAEYNEITDKRKHKLNNIINKIESIIKKAREVEKEIADD